MKLHMMTGDDVSQLILLPCVGATEATGEGCTRNTYTRACTLEHI